LAWTATHRRRQSSGSKAWCPAVRRALPAKSLRPAFPLDRRECFGRHACPPRSHRRVAIAFAPFQQAHTSQHITSAGPWCAVSRRSSAGLVPRAKAQPVATCRRKVTMRRIRPSSASRTLRDVGAHATRGRYSGVLSNLSCGSSGRAGTEWCAMLAAVRILGAMGRDLRDNQRRTLEILARSPHGCGHIASVSCCWRVCCGSDSRRRRQRRRGTADG
jgi:hypothetical protein